MESMKLAFGNAIITKTGNVYDIEIPDSETLIRSEKYMNELREKAFAKKAHFRITGPKNIVVTPQKSYFILNDKNKMFGSIVTTIAELVKVVVEEKNGLYVYNFFFKNLHNPTGFKAYVLSKHKVEFKLYKNYIVNGNLTVENREEKEYEKNTGYMPYKLAIKKMKVYGDAPGEKILNIEEKQTIKRYPLSMVSKYGGGFTDQRELDRAIAKKRLGGGCFTDYNPLNWVEYDSKDTRVAGIKFKVLDDVMYGDSIFITVFLKGKDSTINYNGDEIVVNEGVKLVNEIISNRGVVDVDSKVFLTDLLKGQEEGYFLLGSMDKEGPIANYLLNKDNERLDYFTKIIDVFGVEPVRNFTQWIFKKGAFSIRKVRELNKEIIDLAETTGKKAVFSDNAVLFDKEDIEAVKIYKTVEKLKKKKLKPTDKKYNIYLKETIKELYDGMFPHIYLGSEIKLELEDQGISSENIEKLLRNEKEIFDSLPKMNEITIVPDYLFVPEINGAKINITTTCVDFLNEKYNNNVPGPIKERLKQELKLICDKKYEGIFYAAVTAVKRSRDRGFEVGSRGTMGNLLVAYCLGISDVNPLPEAWDLDYRMFLGPNGEKVPDLDINFSSEIVNEIRDELAEFYPMSSMRATEKPQTISELGILSKNLLKMPKIAKNRDVDYLAWKLSGISAGTKEHVGVIFYPEGLDLSYIAPLMDHKGKRIFMYDYHKIDRCLIKLDILSKHKYDLLKRLDNYKSLKDIPLDIEEVYEAMRNLKTDEIPEFGTRNVKEILKVVQPKTIDDLIKIQGLSHGKGIFYGNAEVLIKQGKEYIATREDLLSELDKYGVTGSFGIMEKIRKGNHSKFTKEEAQELEKLPEYLKTSVMKIKYLFPKAHAVSYAVSSYLIAVFYLWENEIIKKEKNDEEPEKTLEEIMEEFV